MRGEHARRGRASPPPRRTAARHAAMALRDGPGDPRGARHLASDQRPPRHQPVARGGGSVHGPRQPHAAARRVVRPRVHHDLPDRGHRHGLWLRALVARHLAVPEHRVRRPAAPRPLLPRLGRGPRLLHGHLLHHLPAPPHQVATAARDAPVHGDGTAVLRPGHRGARGATHALLLRRVDRLRPHLLRGRGLGPRRGQARGPLV
mmetsp:Transcript_18686/g.54757  ORF Transcript_18686/g.54757 Transcript_18686/m.54757 type:complete len:204 (-) Transcript_18686:946-1557(-)